MRRGADVVVLVTGFGAFPNAPRNPTTALVDGLAAHAGRLHRLGIRLELAILPVVYGEVGGKLAALLATTRPDAILHLGLAARRKAVSVETRAVNRLGMLHPDARGRCAPAAAIIPEGAPIWRARAPAGRLVVALAAAGVPTRLSIDAGDYVCNQTLYLSLATTAAGVGFIHVPRLAGRAALARMTRGLLAAIIVAGQAARRGF